jgi:hypothetical protein
MSTIGHGRQCIEQVVTGTLRKILKVLPGRFDSADWAHDHPRPGDGRGMFEAAHTRGESQPLGDSRFSAIEC